MKKKDLPVKEISKPVEKKEWICHICNDTKYSMGNRWNHLRSKKHQSNIDFLKEQGLPIPEIIIKPVGAQLKPIL